MGATGALPTLCTAEALDQLIQAPQLSAVHRQLLHDVLPSSAKAFKQGPALFGRCLQVRNCRLDLSQSESHVARRGNELEFGQRVLVVVAIAIGKSARRRDEAGTLVEPQCVPRQAAVRFKPLDLHTRLTVE